jgi:hypothetical protein
MYSYSVIYNFSVSQEQAYKEGCSYYNPALTRSTNIFPLSLMVIQNLFSYCDLSYDTV